MRTGARTGGVLLRFFMAALLLAVICCGAIAYLLLAPYQGFGRETILEIPKGTGTNAIGRDLAQAGVVRYWWQFPLARALRPHARLQAGEYQFTEPASVWTVYERMVRGDIFYHELTIPEGSNIFDISRLVDQLGFIRGEDFTRVARDPALIRDLAPDAPSLEGYLFPSTYRLTRGTTALQLCRMMTDLFRREWKQLPQAGRADSVNQTVTLASMVEKETGLPGERPKVASVYLNRLRAGMTLDCDPTTIYAALLEQRYRGVIHRSDLNSGNAYNTYRHAGLPPGPIASPGMASLKAALSPAQTDYLYFVARADGSGGHNFSATLAEHDRQVQEYRRAVAK